MENLPASHQKKCQRENDPDSPAQIVHGVDQSPIKGILSTPMMRSKMQPIEGRLRFNPKDCNGWVTS
jgi:hypothetical protein